MNDEEAENFVIEDAPKSITDVQSEPKKKIKALTFYQSIKIGPIEKYIKYGIFPWKMIISILLVILTICQTVLIISNTTSFSRAQIRTFYNLFVDDSDKTDLDYKKIVYLYTIEELRDHIKKSIENYYNISKLNFEDIEYPEGNPSPIMEVFYIDNKYIYEESTIDQDEFHEFFNGVDQSQPLLNSRQFYYKLNSSSLGPFDYDRDIVRRFINDVVQFKINYTFNTKYDEDEEFTELNQWSVTQIYSFEARAHFLSYIDIKNTFSRSFQTTNSSIILFANKLLWVHILVLILAFAGLYQIMSSINILIKMFMEAKKRFKKKKEIKNKEKTLMETESTSSKESNYYNPLFVSSSSEEENITKVVNEADGGQIKYSLFAEDKKKNETQKKKIEPKKHFQYLMFWALLGVMGNIFQIIGAILALNKPDEVSTYTCVLVGLGCFFACIYIGKYIEFHSDFAIIYETLKRSFPVVIRYLIGVFPIFLGFLFFGLCVFWRSEKFSSASKSSYSLFAMIQGDAIYDSFSNLARINLIGQIYCYAFCITFIIIVWNIFISIIEEAYVVTKIRNKTSWVYNYIDLQPKLVNMKLHSKPSLEATKKYFSKMDKTSKMLTKKISKSFKSHENKNRSLQNSFEDKDYANSLSKFSPNKKKEFKPRYYIIQEPNYPESIPEKDEFDVIISRKNTDAFKDVEHIKEKIIENRFNDVEKRFERIVQLTNNLMKKSKQPMSKFRSNNLSNQNLEKVRNRARDLIINKINAIENMTKELRHFWLST